MKQFHVVEIENGWLVTAVEADIANMNPQSNGVKQTVYYCVNHNAVSDQLKQLMDWL